MKVFVTGATGYIGHQLVKVLAEMNNTVHILVRDINSPNILQHANIKIFKGDITEPKSIDSAIAGCERVYHAAAFAKLTAKDPSVFFKVNVEGTRNILEASLKHGVKRLVFTSSGGVFGPSLKTPLCENDPRIVSFESDYDLTKHLAENLVREYTHKGLYGVIVNPSKVYGPGLITYSNAINRFISWVLFKKFVVVPAIGKVESNYSFINDVINGHLLAMEKGLAGERYIIGGENISFNELVQTVLLECGKKNNLVKLPIGLMKFAGSLKNIIAKLVGHEPDFTPRMISRLVKDRTLSCNKAMRQLGYQITPFKEGIKQTIHYLKQQSHA